MTDSALRAKPQMSNCYLRYLQWRLGVWSIILLYTFYYINVICFLLGTKYVRNILQEDPLLFKIYRSILYVRVTQLNRATLVYYVGFHNPWCSEGIDHQQTPICCMPLYFCFICTQGILLEESHIVGQHSYANKLLSYNLAQWGEAMQQCRIHCISKS